MRHAPISVPIFLSLLLSGPCVAGPAVTAETPGLTIEQDAAASRQAGQLIIKGVLATFVNCGSQYAIWHQFPAGVRFRLTDLETGRVHESPNREMSISWNGNQVYEHYRKAPCDSVVRQDFSLSLAEVFPPGDAPVSVRHFSLQAEYVGHRSNTLHFRDTLVRLRAE